MVNGVRTLRRDRTAIACSIALHCCALAAFAVVLGRLTLAPTDPDERTIVAAVLHIDRRAPVQRAASRRAPGRAVVAAPPQPAPHLHVLRSSATTTAATRVAAERRYGSGSTGGSAIAPATPSKPLPAPVAVDSPAIATATAERPVPVIAARDDAIGNFGENYPAKIDPQQRGGIFAGIGDDVLLRIDVDENGRVTSVEFVRAPADPALKEALRTRILAARFIPAACNGLRCADTVELHN